MECPCLPCRMVTKRSKHIDLTSLVVWKLLLSFFLNSIIKYGFIFFFDADQYFTPLPPKPSFIMMGRGGGGRAEVVDQPI